MTKTITKQQAQRLKLSSTTGGTATFCRPRGEVHSPRGNGQYSFEKSKGK